MSSFSRSFRRGSGFPVGRLLTVRTLAVLLMGILVMSAHAATARPRLLFNYNELAPDGRILGISERLAVFRIDDILHVYDFLDGSFTNLGLDGYLVDDIRFVGNGLAVRESTDRPFFFFDPETDSVTDLSLNAREWVVYGPNLLIWSRESVRFVDLNGDGDRTDFVVHVYDSRDSTLRNLGLAGDLLEAVSDGNIIAFAVREAAQGEDLNGDGDMHDQVLHCYDGSTGVTTNLELQTGRVVVESGLITFLLFEGLTGVDFNGDLDELDRVLHSYDPQTGNITNLRVAEPPGHNTLVAGETVYGLLSELQNNIDRNGDGDLEDNVLQVIDPRSGNAINSGLAFSGFPIHVTPDRAYGSISEMDQGQTDLNGDGDLDDSVLCEIDSTTGQAFFYDIAAEILGGNELVVAFFVPEYRQGGVDLNRDGDSGDKILHVLEIATGRIRNCGFHLEFPETLKIEGHLVAFSAHEGHQGRDLNGDGDMTDNVPYYYDVMVDKVTYIDAPNRGGFNQANALTISGDYILTPRSNPVIHDTISYLTTSVADNARVQGKNVALVTSGAVRGERVIGVARLRSPGEGTVNAGNGEVTSVLRINGETKRAMTTVDSPVNVTLDAAPAGTGAYLVWVWNSLPTTPYIVTVGPADLGCTLLPTPLFPAQSPQPQTCLRSPLVVREPCAGLDSRVGPESTPFSFTRQTGFPRPTTLTIQAVMEDAGATNQLGWSVTNAVTLRVIEAID